MTTLYKLNTRNLVSWWRITQEDNTYLIEWGQDHNNQSRSDNSSRHECVSTDRAAFEVTSRTDRQIKRRGYTVHVPRTKPDRPMLAQDWSKHLDLARRGRRAPFPNPYVQPKLDGMRCIATQTTMVSRQAKPITCLPHIQQTLEQLPPGIKLDGELYIHNTSLQTILSICKRDYAHRLHAEVQYHVFDIVDEEMPFSERYQLLKQVVTDLRKQQEQIRNFLEPVPEALRTKRVPDKFPLQVVPSIKLDDESISMHVRRRLKEHFALWTADNYEGVIVRCGDAPYEIDTRSQYLLKYKERQSAEFEIVDIVKAHGELGIFVCKTEDGKIFRADPAWTHEYRHTLWKRREKYIGRFVQVEYEKLSDDGIPLKPKGKLVQDTATSHQG